jgi:CheY-like chemotaxis protein
VRADPDRMQQIVWNLLNNAVKFTPPGGSVRTALRRLGDHVQIEITDTGRGIAPEFLPHVFDRFSQADNALTRQTGGLGLGLAIARQLVHLHDGTIRAESAGNGKGATFTVDFPMVDVRLQTFAARRGEAQIASAGAGGHLKAEPVLHGTRVLLVEDDASTRRGIQLLLEQSAAEVAAAADADEAIALLKADRAEFDLVLSDISMPGKDGYQMLGELRQLQQESGKRSIPAIALSALARAEDRGRALAAGFESHLPKPVEPGELIAMIRRVLQSEM